MKKLYTEYQPGDLVCKTYADATVYSIIKGVSDHYVHVYFCVRINGDGKLSPFQGDCIFTKKSFMSNELPKIISRIKNEI